MFNIPPKLHHRKWRKSRHTACQQKLRRNMHALFSVCSLRDDNVITSKPTWKLMHKSAILESLIFLPNVIKIDPYNFEQYGFKVGAFFETLVNN